MAISNRRIRGKFEANAGDMWFQPDLPNQQVYPTGDDATRSVLLWEWALDKYDANDVRVFGDDGVTAYNRWLNLEGLYFLSEDELDLPGEAPGNYLASLGLISE